MKLISCKALCLVTLAVNQCIFGINGILPGTGTQADPYLIEDRADFDVFCLNADDYSAGGVYTELMTDLDLSDTAYTDAPFLDTYYGAFEGNGYLISGLTINTGSNLKNGIGLFHKLTGSSSGYPTISNLGLENVSITVPAGSSNVGALVGESVGTITNCYATGEIIAGNASAFVGGLVGQTRYRILQSYANVNILAGEECMFVGGLTGNAGTNSATLIRDCYAVGKITTGSNSRFVSGLVTTQAEDVRTSYFYVWSGQDNRVGTDLSADELASQASYVGFDFIGDDSDGSGEIWAITSGHLPRLYWEDGNGIPIPSYGAPATDLAGSGSIEDPFIINTISDFNEFASNQLLDRGYYRLDADLDLSGIPYSSAVIDRTFGGTFDGNEHSLSNIHIELPTNLDNDIGLFSILNGHIKRLSVTNFSLTTTGNQQHIGAIAGQNCGLIEECFASVDIQGGALSSHIGGISGLINGGEIRNSYAAGTVSGYENIGGLTGGTLDNNLNNYISVAGTLVYVPSKLTNSYSVVSVPDYNSSSEEIGPVAGHDTVSSNTYFYEWAGQTNHIGSAQSASALKDQVSYAGFDFAGDSSDGEEEIWIIEEGELAKFAWQTEEAPLPPEYIRPETTLTGEGTAGSPFVINDQIDFAEFASNEDLYAGTYKLTADINMGDTIYSAAPIDRPFSGTFDGNGFEISGLRILNSTTSNLGLFSETGGTIKNLSLTDFLISCSSPRDYIGSITGYNSGNISNCKVYGTITNGDDYIGGIAGYHSNGSIMNCYSAVEINSEQSGGYYIGLICGYQASGLIKNTKSAGTIHSTASTAYYLGGITGTLRSDAEIDNCHSTSVFTLDGDVQYLGGIAGYSSYGSINTCSANVSITVGDTSSHVGGLLGASLYGTIKESLSKGEIETGANPTYIGGLMGLNERTPVSDAYSKTSIQTGDNPNHVGGLFGRNVVNSSTRCYAAGKVTTGSGGSNIGGLTGSGSVNGTMEAAYWDTLQSTQLSSRHGEAKTTAEMQDETTFTDAGWDFGGLNADSSKADWIMIEYPEFTWADADNDGIANDIETILETDPSDPHSKLETIIQSAQKILVDPMVDGMEYKCLWTTDLNRPVAFWKTLEIEPTQTGNSGEFTLADSIDSTFLSRDDDAVFFSILATPIEE